MKKNKEKTLDQELRQPVKPEEQLTKEDRSYLAKLIESELDKGWD